MRKFQNTSDRLIPIAFIVAILILWQAVVATGLVERYILPSPLDIINALAKNWSPILMHTGVTFLKE